MKLLVRAMYSSPPVHGSRIVEEVLSDPGLRNQWREECKSMAERIQKMRFLLRNKLESGTGKPWPHITDQIGMFWYVCYTHCNTLYTIHTIHTIHTIYTLKHTIHTITDYT